MAANSDGQRDFGKWVALAGAGLAIFVPIVIGSILDKHLGWQNWGTLGGVVIGFVAGISYLLAVLKRFQDPPEPPKREQL